MNTPSWRAVACALLAVTLWAGTASPGNAEPVGADHGWVDAGVGVAGSETRVEWGGCETLPDPAGAGSIGSCPLEWRVRALTIGGVGHAAEHLRRKLPVLSALVAERGGDLGHWLALLPWNGI